LSSFEHKAIKVCSGSQGVGGWFVLQLLISGAEVALTSSHMHFTAVKTASEISTMVTWSDDFVNVHFYIKWLFDKQTDWVLSM